MKKDMRNGQLNRLAQNAKSKILKPLFILLLLSAYYLLLTTDTQAMPNIFNLDIIPAPPRSVRVETYKEQAEINQKDFTTNTTHYQSALSPEELIDFYRQKLPAKDWRLQGKAIRGSVALASFSKGKEDLSISVYSSRGRQSDVYIRRSASLQNTRAQNGDAPGKDLSWAPRYPGATRTLSRRDKQTGAITITYTARGELDDILDFYQRKMANNDWNLINDVQLAQLPGIGRGSYTTLFFTGFRGRCQVSVNKAFASGGEDNSASVLINYLPRGFGERM